MPLGPNNPEWVALGRALRALMLPSHARNVYVLDVWGSVWCAARADEDSIEDGLIEAALAQVAKVRPPLPRGGSIDGPLRLASESVYVRSFAAIYVLLLTFRRAMNLAEVRLAVGSALPKIEALTVALPPSDGPGAGGAQGFGVA